MNIIPFQPQSQAPTETSSITARVEKFLSERPFLRVSRDLVEVFGADQALFLANLLDKLLYYCSDTGDGWFYQTHKQQMKATGLTEYTIRQCKKFFVELGILKIQWRGVPAKEWYFVDLEKLESYLGDRVIGTVVLLQSESQHSLETLPIPEKVDRLLFTKPFLRVSKDLIEAFGSDQALFLANLLDKLLYCCPDDKGGWFYQTHAQQTKATGLTEYTIRRCKNFFVKLGILEIQFKGVPPKEWYFIDLEELERYLDDLPTLKNSETLTLKNSETLTLKNSETLYNNKMKTDNKTKTKIDNIEINKLISKNQILSDLIEGNLAVTFPELYQVEESPMKIGDEFGELGKEVSMKKRKIATPAPTPQPHSKKRREYPYEAKAWELIDYWQSLACGEKRLPHFRSEASKTYKKTKQALIQILKGTHPKLPKLTARQIKEVMRLHALQALDPDYEPSGSFKEYLRKLPLYSWIYNPYAEEGSPTRSRLLYLVEHPEEVAKIKPKRRSVDLPDDPNPILTDHIKDLWVKYRLGGVYPKEWSSDHERGFRIISKRLMEFFDKHRMRLSLGIIAQQKPLFALAELMFESLDDKMNGRWREVTLGWFIHDRFWDYDFPAYLSDMAMLVNYVSKLESLAKQYGTSR